MSANEETNVTLWRRARSNMDAMLDAQMSQGADDAKFIRHAVLVEVCAIIESVRDDARRMPDTDNQVIDTLEMLLAQVSSLLAT